MDLEWRAKTVAGINPSDIRSAPLENLENSPNCPSDGARTAPIRFRRGATVRALALASFALLCMAATVCQAQSREEVVCNAGDGSFESAFRTGVKVWVGASRNGELATRACNAELWWKGQVRVVATGAPRIDVDAFGADLGLGVPVAAVQVQKSDDGCCVSYQIYSLEQPPKLLRTLTGGSFFSAADTDLDGHVEIWTDDSAAFDGFENLDLRQTNAAPTIVLRFTKGQLLDVSAEFASDYDRIIAAARAGLDARRLGDFKNSDGRLAAADSSLREVKLRVLEIVWSYLYSGREQQAWQALAELWPPADAGRIRAAILQARGRGIRAQLDGGSTAATTGEVPSGRKGQAEIFDGIRAQINGVSTGFFPGPGRRPRSLEGASSVDASLQNLVLPEAIEMWSPPMTETEVLLDLVVDAAGKVHSAEPVDHLEAVHAGLLQATAEWKFIPAFKDGRAVACRVRVSASPKR